MNVDDINALESEAGVIATLFHNPKFCFLSDSLLPNHFSDKYNQCIYAAIQCLAAKGINTIDPYNILESLGAIDGVCKCADGLTIERLQEFAEMSDVLARSSPEEYKLLAKNVMDAAFRRDAFKVLRECEALCFDRSQDEIAKQIYGKIDDVMMDFATVSDIPELKDVVEGIWEEIEARSRGETTAIEFPFPKLNKYVVMEPGEVVCFTAPAKAGKSAMLLTCAHDLISKGKSVLYIDSELSTKLWTVRMIAHITKVPFGRLRAGNYSEDEREKIREAIKFLKSSKIIHVYMPVLDASTMYMAAKKAKHLIDIDVVIVDYLKADSSKDGAYEVYANLGNIADTLKNRIAGDMGICGLTAAQSTDSGKIADSARIARSMSTVVSIIDKTKEQIANEGTGSTKLLRVQFNRNGAQMRDNEGIDMMFDGSTCSYWQCASQTIAEEPW